MTATHAVAIIDEISKAIGTVTITTIKEAVREMDTMSVAELSAVQREVLGAAIGTSKKAKLASIEELLSIRHRDARRVAAILAS